MPRIKSDSGTVSMYVGTLTEVSDLLLQSLEIGLDNSSTINGNTAAHQAIERSLKTSSLLVQVVESASKNLQQTAQNFEEIDKRMANSMDRGV